MFFLWRTANPKNLEHDFNMTWHDCKHLPFFFPGMADCCKWLREQGLDLGATNNQGEDVFSVNTPKISSFDKLPRATQVTMPCTRQHMVVMQHCVLGCRSGPPGVSSGFNFWNQLEKIRHLFCDLGLPGLCCFGSWSGGCEVRKNTVKSSHWTTDFSVSGFVGWEIWNIETRGQTCAALAEKAGFQAGNRHSMHLSVSENRGFFPPKSSIFIGFSITNHPFWGTTIVGNPHLARKKLLFPFHSLKDLARSLAEASQKKAKQKMVWKRSKLQPTEQCSKFMLMT